MSHFTGTTKFYWKSTAPAESGLAIKENYVDQLATNLIPIEVETRRLDDVIDFKIDYLKADIEGAEIDMLNGAQETVRRSRPIISVEYGANGYRAFGHTQASLLEWAREQEYAIFDLFGNAFSSPAEFLACVDRYYWDYILIPEEQRPQLRERLAIWRRIAWPIPLNVWRATNLDIVDRP